MDISVIISTYNRSSLLKKCLDSLANQTVSKKKFEVLVVDNNSRDDTKDVFKKWRDDHPEMVSRYFLEKKQGLSHAKNRGLKESEGEYVAFLDDDARADPKWLWEIDNRLKKNKKIVIIGGQIIPWYESTPPKWFKKSYESRGYGMKFLAMDHPGLSGSNIVFKKSWLKVAGGFDVELGMKGKRLMYGEETKIQLKFLKEDLGNRCWYDPKIKVSHLVPKSKMRVGYYFKKFFNNGRSRLIMDKKKVNLSDVLWWVRSAVLIPFKVFKLCLRDRNKYKYWQRYLVEEVAPMSTNVGRLYQFLRGKA